MWIYSQRLGTLYHDAQYIGQGYSGYGGDCNNPDSERKRNVGPIPAGSYRIGPAETTTKGSYTMRLTPIGHTVFPTLPPRDASSFLWTSGKELLQVMTRR